MNSWLERLGWMTAVGALVVGVVKLDRESCRRAQQFVDQELEANYWRTAHGALYTLYQATLVQLNETREQVELLRAENETESDDLIPQWPGADE